MSETISVIVPFYKGNKYINNLIKNIDENGEIFKEKGQDVNIELLIVNDSPEIEVKVEYQTELNYRIVNHKINCGIHQARVTGLNACIGNFIKFLDQDDELSKDCLFEQYNNILDNDVIISNAMLEQKDGRIIPLYSCDKNMNKALHLKNYLYSHNQIVSPGQCLIRKEAIPIEWKENIMTNNGSDDLFLWILQFSKEKKFCIYNKMHYKHRYTGENLSESVSKMANSSLTFKSYLKKIPYVSKKNVEVYSRSRNLTIEWTNSKNIKKIIVSIKYIDIFLMRFLLKFNIFNLLEEKGFLEK